MSKIIAISEAVSIAIHGMVLIARSNEDINVTQIAQKTDTSKHHVAKIMQRLVKDNLLVSQRGPKGGFKMKKEPADITFLDILESIDGKIDINECPLDKGNCPFDECLFGDIATKVSLEFKNYLQSQTLDKHVKKVK